MLDLIDQLPMSSRTWEALLNDPEIADEYAKAEADNNTNADAAPVKPRPRLADDSATVRAIRQLNNDIRALLGGKRASMLPGPQTGIDQARRRRATARAAELTRALTPVHYTPR
ncbi:hypothetical protein H8R18_01320 [Nanchangia anserum]|uniref:Uncharacterized protein n=1 Tax=Nanchangia anserum TaxID=2692125 RepID=A0A8I0GFH2_9ACTO|nr:hypothetical protein [Nanchangia anserum]MBD3689877.1 hypothetical protein [Nanchangia anserum]QOX82045.1 hypothetical protein H8R18_01320 [Nanchangia anserum]